MIEWVEKGNELTATVGKYEFLIEGPIGSFYTLWVFDGDVCLVEQNVKRLEKAKSLAEEYAKDSSLWAF